MRSNADLLAIKAELANDPTALGLTTIPTDDEVNGTKLSEVRETITVKKRSLGTAVVFNAVVAPEYQALSPQQRAWFDALLTLGQFDPFLSPNIVAELQELFPPESVSRAGLDAKMSMNGNRLDQMFQAGLLETAGIVNGSDVSMARAAV